jgi:transposase InsO family protein
MEVEKLINGAAVAVGFERMLWAPAFLRSDNGPEFISLAMLRHIVERSIATALIKPGKPWQNGVVESFNGKFSDECLSLEWLCSRAEVNVVIEQWRMQLSGTLWYMEPPSPAKLHHRPTWDNSRKEPASQVNRDPKKHGRSL